MENLRVIVLLFGSALILLGYFRLISDSKGNVELNSYRFTGGIFLVVGGMVEGTLDLFRWSMSKKCVSTLSIYLGALLFYLSFGN